MGDCFDNFTTYAATPFSADSGNTLLYYYSGGNGPHNGVRTSQGIQVRDDAIARAEGSAYAVAGLAHRDPVKLSRVLTRPVRIAEDRPSLWITIGRNAAIGVQSTSLELMVELRQFGVPMPEYGVAKGLSSASKCAVDLPCRLKLRWSQSLLRLAGQEVEVAITFRGYVIYSLSQE